MAPVVEVLKEMIDIMRRYRQQIADENQQRINEVERQRIDEVSSVHQQITEKHLEVNEKMSSNVDRHAFKSLPKLEFPSFDGTNPRKWIKKCSRYFALCNIPDSQRVDVASIHLTGKAETWFARYSAVRKNVDWCDFILDVCTCFKEELGVTRQPNSGSGNPPSVDDPQVLDKSPKSNPDICSHGWVGKGQGDSSVGSRKSFGEQLEGLNGLLEKSLSSIHDKDLDLCEREVKKDDCCDEHHPLADAHQVFDKSPSAGDEVVPSLDHFQQPPDPNPLMHVAHPFQQTSNFSGQNPKKNAHSKPVTEWPTTSVVVYADCGLYVDCGSLLHANSSGKGLGSVAEQVPSQELELSGCEGSYVGLVIRQHCEVWQVMTPHAHRMEGGWPPVRFSCSKRKTLKPLSYESHGWKWVKFSSFIVFDPGKSGARQGTPKPTSLAFMCAWLGEIFAASKLSVVRLVFDPGETIFTCLKSYSKVGFSGGVYMYNHQPSCDGGCLYDDGYCFVVVNGGVATQGSQFSLKDVEVAVAQVDRDAFASLKGSISSFQEQASCNTAVSYVTTPYKLCKPFHLEEPISCPLKIKYHVPEEEIAFGPACWLWDYLRSGASGFFLSDSSSVAAVVGCICQLVANEIEMGAEQVKADAIPIGQYAAGQFPTDSKSLVQSCSEYIKFLAAFLVGEMQADMMKGVMASTPLRHHYTVQPLPTAAENVAYKHPVARLALIKMLQVAALVVLEVLNAQWFLICPFTIRCLLQSICCTKGGCFLYGGRKPDTGNRLSHVQGM